MSHAIETRGLGYRAGKRFEIRDLELRIPQGSIYGFLGANGSGKTTTMHLVLGLLRADRGTIEVLGHEIPEDVVRVNARTGFVPERPHLYRSLTIDETLGYESAFYSHWDAGRASQLIDAFGLDRDRRVGRLSKGETGQLMVLLALARSPELLVLDEPTDGLDPVVRRDILAALLDYVSQREATVFISSHLVHELERVCDWVGVIDDGRMVAEMPMQVFKEGIKRLRVTDAPEVIGDPPFEILGRERTDGLSGAEVWVVRGWEAPMKGYFGDIGANLRETIDLDLEEGFVELLRTARASRGEEVS
ncbi:MAG: ABC transporter ATP-binding protein [Gemmatimonadetes bacterium]|uniref:ABC transporter ATP-binding protein n=1 Tax=Candidatus Kutchimonas denitrificans TaxID=3056748 RepID=A0AAE4Z8X0_9BACT|nr:ABC transporter ATP-binding protein [Gemmatimonadota bacterium]NIR74647.1 ABC transporter ATP-binding protein [Candidatus Kutchimonas denitrificans]NIS02837.1 ABC transporter ATP-binding protein [Gemmatimonadota bacterium]NIT68998.1 ABC transporter ATP-binding protein [Gemmatimonadota bacterium]NIU52303.1 ATP-binding cassette domain-containing protein [Gemmatimonadota bacterium]